MKYYGNFLSFNLILVSTVTLSLVDEKKVSALGCDTYYRVTGQIAGCTDVSTENIRDLWLEKYSICLERQIDREISIYRGKLRTYSVDRQDGFEQNQLNNTSLQNANVPSLSLSNNYLTRYRGSADFCARESE
jgi:hypothetical protein